MKPVKIKIEPLLSMNINWDNGTDTVIKLANLRKECPCAECKSDRSKNSKSYIPIYSDEQLLIKEIKISGKYAVNIIWGDDHSTGYYMFDYLFSISQNVSKL
ncbi:MAG: DUF971 domain-containing protein [bacterium]